MTAYFHGGIAGLEIGDRILPASITGVKTTADYGAASRRDRVYATTELRVARVYAAVAPFGGRGDVYEVALDEPIDFDCGDLPGGDSVCAPSATVIKVVEHGVDLRVARAEIAADLFALAAIESKRA